MTVYGYWRCSTDIQDQERQIVALKKMQCSEIYGDHISGKSDFNARPQLTKCLNALKSGGNFGVVEHRADDAASLEYMKKSGYVSQALAIEVAQQVGFTLISSSEINANPKDTKDHPKGVWTLLPNLRLGEEDKDKYIAIGESDRMTLLFVKE